LRREKPKGKGGKKKRPKPSIGSPPQSTNSMPNQQLMLDCMQKRRKEETNKEHTNSSKRQPNSSLSPMQAKKRKKEKERSGQTN
jgi:hypothetical protein